MKCGEHISWYFDDETGKLTIDGTGDMWDRDYANEYHLLEGVWDNTRVRSVEFKGSVRSLGDGAFANADKLVSIRIPSTVTYIGNNALYGCSSLLALVIPESVTDIGKEAFSECGQLGAIYVSPDNPAYCSVDGILYNKNKSVLVQYPKGRAGDKFTIPDGVECLAMSSFSGCKLTSIHIPDTVINIDAWAFMGCNRLTKVVLPKTMDEIGWSVFKDCTELTRVEMPSSVLNIGLYLFDGCTKLKEIVNWQEQST